MVCGAGESAGMFGASVIATLWQQAAQTLHFCPGSVALGPFVG